MYHTIIVGSGTRNCTQKRLEQYRFLPVRFRVFFPVHDAIIVPDRGRGRVVQTTVCNSITFALKNGFKSGTAGWPSKFVDILARPSCQNAAFRHSFCAFLPAAVRVFQRLSVIQKQN